MTKKQPEATLDPSAPPPKGRRPASRNLEAKMLRLILEALGDIKAEEPVVLDLRKLTSMTDYFVVAHGTNERQVQAMAREVESRLDGGFSRRPLHVEGFNVAQWVLMDYGDFIVHLFLAEKRGHYDIERIWADAPRMAP